MPSLNRATKKKIVLIFFIALIIGLYFYYLHPYVTLENFKKNKEIVEAFVATHYLSATILYCLIYMTVVALSLPVALVMSLIGGFLFGTFFGAFLVAISATAGATIAFLIARYIAGDYLQRRYNKELISFNQEIKEYGAFYLILVHFFPFIPFFVINILSALTNISVTTFIVTTLVGIIPTTLLYTAIGHQLATLDKYPTYTITILAILTLIALVLLVIFIVMRRKKNSSK